MKSARIVFASHKKITKIFKNILTCAKNGLIIYMLNKFC